MNKRNKIVAALAGSVLALSMAACSVPDKSSGEISEFTVTLADGTQVPCFKIHGYDGYECNFDKAVRTQRVTP